MPADEHRNRTWSISTRRSGQWTRTIPVLATPSSPGLSRSAGWLGFPNIESASSESVGRKKEEVLTLGISRNVVRHVEFTPKNHCECRTPLRRVNQGTNHRGLLHTSHMLALRSQWHSLGVVIANEGLICGEGWSNPRGSLVGVPTCRDSLGFLFKPPSRKGRKERFIPTITSPPKADYYCSQWHLFNSSCQLCTSFYRSWFRIADWKKKLNPQSKIRNPQLQGRFTVLAMTDYLHTRYNWQLEL